MEVEFKRCRWRIGWIFVTMYDWQLLRMIGSFERGLVGYLFRRNDRQEKMRLQLAQGQSNNHAKSGRASSSHTARVTIKRGEDAPPARTRPE